MGWECPKYIKYEFASNIDNGYRLQRFGETLEM